MARILKKQPALSWKNLIPIFQTSSLFYSTRRDLPCKKCHWDRVFSEYFRFPLTVLIHTHSFKYHQHHNHTNKTPFLSLPLSRPPPSLSLSGFVSRPNSLLVFNTLAMTYSSFYWLFKWRILRQMRRTMDIKRVIIRYLFIYLLILTFLTYLFILTSLN